MEHQRSIDHVKQGNFFFWLAFLVTLFAAIGVITYLWPRKVEENEETPVVEKVETPVVEQVERKPATESHTDKG